jgi:FtsH-binding integral membrane protein
MAFNSFESNSFDSASGPNRVLAESTASAFMARVYTWMFAGLLVTAGTAFFTASNAAMLGPVLQHSTLLLVAQLGIVVALTFLAPRMAGPVTAALFLAYSALTGLTFSVIFLIFQLGSVVQVFGLTALLYGTMAVYGTVTKRDLSSWRSFLFMGLIGVVLAGLVQMFVHSDMLSFVMSCVSVVVFTGLAAYDNQKLRALHASSGYSSALSLSVTGALILYLDFINLFLALLQLFGRRRD